jgi:hypothetical protein
MDKKSGKKGVLIVAYNEFKKERLEKRILFFFLIIFFISIFILLIFLASRFLITGFATYIQAKAGYITEVTIEQRFASYYWHGTYGLAFPVSGFNENLSHEARAGEIVRQDLFFDCMPLDPSGGKRVYASTSPIINFNELAPATQIGRAHV